MLARWLRGRRGDMVWNAVILFTVFLPLASLAVDVPRYYILRSRLQGGVDAAAEAAVRSLDVRAWRDGGEVRFDRDRALYEAATVFFATTAPLLSKGYVVSLDEITLDEANDTATVRASGTTRLFFGLSPEVTVRVTGHAKARIIREP